VSEPTTVATDYALAIVSVVLALRLAAARPRASLPGRLWAASFLALAVAGLAGGTWHAIPAGVLTSLRSLLWSITYVAIGVADLLLLAGAAQSALAGWPRRAALALVAGRFLVYAPCVVALRGFGVVAVEFAVTVACLLLFGLDLARRRESATAFVLAAGVASLAGGLVQALHLTLHVQFNHNDLFHVIQMAGIWLMFRGALLLHDGPRPWPRLTPPAAASTVSP
jgi:hypothetical protein